MGIIKQIQDPTYSAFTKRHRKGIEIISEESILAPNLIWSAVSNPLKLADFVNNQIKLYNLKNGELVYSQVRTREMQRVMIERAPRLMMAHDEASLYVKIQNEDLLEYAIFQSRYPLRLLSSRDYAFGRDAASAYAERVGIATRKDLENAEKNGRLECFQSIQKWKQLKVYYLRDIHRLKGLKKEHVA